MSHPVRSAAVAIAIRAVALTLCLAVHGCSDVHGGAVELSWKLRASAGSSVTFLDCAIGLPGTGNVEKIRLDWDVDGAQGSREWLCTDDHGATGFELPEGTALLSVSPVCATHDAAPETYTAPAPEQRRVIAGNTINLGGVELLLEVSSCEQQVCICQ
jgi:hypothetical protein